MCCILLHATLSQVNTGHVSTYMRHDTTNTRHDSFMSACSIGGMAYIQHSVIFISACSTRVSKFNVYVWVCVRARQGGSCFRTRSVLITFYLLKFWQHLLHPFALFPCAWWNKATPLLSSPGPPSLCISVPFSLSLSLSYSLSRSFHFLWLDSKWNTDSPLLSCHQQNCASPPGYEHTSTVFCFLVLPWAATAQRNHENLLHHPLKMKCRRFHCDSPRVGIHLVQRPKKCRRD